MINIEAYFDKLELKTNFLLSLSPCSIKEQHQKLYKEGVKVTNVFLQARLDCDKTKSVLLFFDMDTELRRLGEVARGCLHAPNIAH